MKKLIKNILVLIIFTIIFIQTSYSLAKTNNLEEVNNGITPIEEEDIKFNKKIISMDNNEIKIKLSLKDYQENKISNNSEIIFVLDNSNSMETITTDTNKKRKIEASGAVKNLIKKINENNNNIKMGIVQFSETASVLSELTNNEQELISACNAYENNIGSSTNIYSGVVTAKKMYETDIKHKIMILLTDGLPTVNENETIEALKDNNIFLISVLTGLKDEENVNAELIKKIFGTFENPNTDRFYNIIDTDLENTICKDIYNNILDEAKSEVSNIEVKDYLPSEIIENFDITLDEVKIGNANLKDTYITWSIQKLSSDEEASLEYTLKLKENYNKNIQNKILDTNKEVTITFTNDENENKQYKTKDNPQIRIVSKEDNEISNSKDDTISKNNLPNAGNKDFIVILGILILVVAIVIRKISFKKFE